MVISKENWGNDVVSKRNYRKSSIKPHGGFHNWTKDQNQSKLLAYELTIPDQSIFY